MKKLLTVLIFISTCLASYGGCFKLTENKTNVSLYGKAKINDFTSSKIYIQDTSANTVCNGFGFEIIPDTALSSKNLTCFAKVKCSDGRLMEINWNKDLVGSAVDQYNNLYTLRKIKQKEYKKSIKKKGKIKNENRV